MRKRGARRKVVVPTAGILMPHQVTKWMLPIYTAIELLPLNLYSEDHAHDLMSLLNVTQFAAVERADTLTITAATRAVEILILARDRAADGGVWQLDDEERSNLAGYIGLVEEFIRRLPVSQFRLALRRTVEWCDQALASGKQSMDVVHVPVGEL